MSHAPGIALGVVLLVGCCMGGGGAYAEEPKPPATDSATSIVKRLDDEYVAPEWFYKAGVGIWLEEVPRDVSAEDAHALAEIVHRAGGRYLVVTASPYQSIGQLREAARKQDLKFGLAADAIAINKGDEAVDPDNLGWVSSMRELIDVHQPEYLSLPGGKPLEGIRPYSIPGPQGGEAALKLIDHYYQEEYEAIRMNGTRWKNGKPRPNRHKSRVVCMDIIGKVPKSSWAHFTVNYNPPLPTEWQGRRWQAVVAVNAETGTLTGTELVRKVVEVASLNGTLLLRVPVGVDGKLDEDASKSLRELGEWVEKYPEWIYATPSRNYFPTTDGKECFFIDRSFKVYAILFRQPQEPIQLTWLWHSALHEVGSVHLLNSKEELKWRQGDSDVGLTIELPSQPPKELPWVIRINHTTTVP
jgi:hypothetical protein